MAATIDNVYWYEDDGVHKCQLHGVTVGEIRYAQEAEGGLGALARFITGALRPDIEQPSFSPAGYYWTATAERGVWCRSKRADDIDSAKAAVEQHIRGLASNEPRRCYFIPADAYVEGYGFRVAIVTEDEPGYALTGTWPYSGKPGETMPYFWGHEYAAACEAAEQQNAKLGLTPQDTDAILCSSIAATHRKAKAAAKARFVHDQG